MKQLMITVKPEYLVDILNGNKTLELRTYIPKDFKGWVNVCCSKEKPYLHYRPTENCTAHYVLWDKPSNEHTLLNSKVVCRFWFDEYSRLQYEYYIDDYIYGNMQLYEMQTFISNLSLNYEQIYNYGKGKDLYAWHIKQLEIFDEPKELGEFQNYYRKEKIDYEPLTHAPQKYAYVWGKEE